MSRIAQLEHRFADCVPERIDDGVLYISMELGTVVHKCCCGCGSEIVTPLARTDWKLTFDGESISLYPSIGNWSFPCRSHYWIRESRVRWAEEWSQNEIDAGRHQDRTNKKRYFAATSEDNDYEAVHEAPTPSIPPPRGWLARLWNRFLDTRR